MTEILSDQTELILNIPQKITEFLEYGINNGGRNKLLDVGVLKKDVFVLSSSWEEVKVVVGNYNNKKSNILEQEIKDIG